MHLHLSLAPKLQVSDPFSPVLLSRQQAHEIYQLLSAAISQGEPDLIRQAAEALPDLAESLSVLLDSGVPRGTLDHAHSSTWNAGTCDG